mgnify:CR=1 FL=1
MQPIVLRLDPRTRHNLEQISRVTGVSRPDIVAEAVRVYVDAKVGELVAQGVLALGEEPAEDASPIGQERWNILV